MSVYINIDKRDLSEETFTVIGKQVYVAVEKLFSFLSVSSLFIGAHGFFKTYVAFILLGMNPSILVCIVVFLITFCVYSLDKIADIDKDITNMPQRRSFLHGRKRLVLACSFAAYLLAFMISLLNKPLTLPLVFLPFIANAFYGRKLYKGIPRLKDIPIVKNIVVALTWASVTVLMPAMHLANPATKTVALVFYFVLIKTLVDNVLYDVRDIKGDRENGVKTMAALMGEQRTVFVLFAANSTLLPLVAVIGKAAWPLALALTLYGYVCILYFRKRRNPLALDFFVEGEWMLIMIAILVLGIA